MRDAWFHLHSPTGVVLSEVGSYFLILPEGVNKYPGTCFCFNNSISFGVPLGTSFLICVTGQSRTIAHLGKNLRLCGTDPVRFNNQGLLVAVSNASGRVESVVYDVIDRATNSVDANAVSVDITYDTLNRVRTRTYPDTGVESFGYTANTAGVTSYTNQLNNVVNYVYDALGRKTSEVYVGVMTNSFTYDALGNL